MRELFYSKRFKKDFKKVSANPNFKEQTLVYVLNSLVKNLTLETKYKDHKLTGELNDWRECHVQPDILLIYNIDQNNKVIDLWRIGSHSDLF